MAADITGTLTGPLRALRDMFRAELAETREELDGAKAEVTQLRAQVDSTQKMAGLFYDAGKEDAAAVRPSPRRRRPRRNRGDGPGFYVVKGILGGAAALLVIGRVAHPVVVTPHVSERAADLRSVKVIHLHARRGRPAVCDCDDPPVAGHKGGSW